MTAILTSAILLGVGVMTITKPKAKKQQQSNKGEVKVIGKGVTEWTDNPNGRYQILVPSEAQRQQILDYFVEILTTKPKKMK